MFKFEPGSFYLMPFHFGPRFRRGVVDVRRRDHPGDQLSHRPEAPLPTPSAALRGRGEPLLSVSFSMNREIEWLAGDVTTSSG